MIMPGYWDGNAIEWNTFFKLLSFGFTQLILFIFLRKVRLSLLFSFLLSFITVYNLRLLELLRDGANLEAYTGYLILCTVIGLQFISPTKWIGPLCIIGTSYLLICSGHPQEMYYGLVAVVIFTCIAPFYVSTMLPDMKVDLRMAVSFWLKIGFLLFLSIMLASVYILSFYFDFMSDNMLRVGSSYAMANVDLDTFAGTVYNFISPLRSQIQSSFGGSFLIIMAVILPVLKIFKIKIPRSIWLIWGILLFMFLHMQGSRTAVHRFVWHYFPFASSIRVAGRIALIMPFFFMLVLAWVVKEDKSSLYIKRFSLRLRPLTILTCLGSILITLYYSLYITGYYILSPAIFKELFTPGSVGYFFNIPFFWIEIMLAILGIASMIALTIYSLRIEMARVLGITLIVVTVIQLGITLKYRGAQWVEDKHKSISFKEMREQKKFKLEYLFLQDPSVQSSTVLIHLSHSFIEPFIGKIYSQITPVRNQNEAYSKMIQARLPQQLFIEGYDPEKAEMITENARFMSKGTVRLVYSSYNRVRFYVNSQARAFFGLSYPYTGHWHAWVNDKEVNVYRANGAAHAVELPEGESFVEFRYWSNAFFWGMIISCTTFAIIGLFVCFRALNGLPKLTGIIIIICISAGGFILWYNSLYSGDNIGTEYTWNYSSPLKTPNYAYGKKNWASLPPFRCVNCGPDFSYTLLVDGDLSTGASIPTLYAVNNPAWFLDLDRMHDIKTILLFENRQDRPAHIRPITLAAPTESGPGGPVNSRPLTVAVSNDENHWRTVASVVSASNHNGLVRIMFDKPETARFIKIEASGECRLSFNEIEVYGPQ